MGNFCVTYCTSKASKLDQTDPADKKNFFKEENATFDFFKSAFLLL